MSTDTTGSVYITFVNIASTQGLVLAFGLGTDAAGNVYTMLSDNGLVRFAPNGTPAIIASAVFSPSLAVDASGNVGFLDDSMAASLLREVTARSMPKTLAGASPQPAPDGTPLRNAWFLDPSWIAFDHNGNLYIAESQACLIRQISTAGVLSTFAGTGTCGSTTPSGNAKTANLVYPVSIAIDSKNNVWVTAENLNFYSIAQDGAISLYPTRTPVEGGKGELAIDSKDRVYVMGLDSLYRVSNGTLQGIIVPPSAGGSGGYSLFGIGTDPSDNVYFNSNQAIYRVNDDGTFTKLYANQGNVGVNGPFAVNAAGVAWSGSAFTSIAGSSQLGESGYSGDGGPAQQPRFGGGQSVFAPNGNLYFIDGNRVRELIWPATAPTAPFISQGGIVNALCYSGGGVAAGELVSVFGSNFSSTSLQTNAP